MGSPVNRVNIMATYASRGLAVHGMLDMYVHISTISTVCWIRMYICVYTYVCIYMHREDLFRGKCEIYMQKTIDMCRCMHLYNDTINAFREAAVRDMPIMYIYMCICACTYKSLYVHVHMYTGKYM